MSTETTQATPAGTALTLPQRAAVALGASEYETKIKEQVAASADIVVVLDPAGRDQAHRIGMNLLKLRTGIKAVGEAARKDATEFSKAVIAKEKDLIALITPEEDRVFKLRDEFDAKVEAEKQAALAKERDRIAAIQADIATIHGLPLELVGQPAAEILNAVAMVGAIAVTKDRFAEFDRDATRVIAEVSAKLASLHVAAVESEAEAARIAAERAELAQLREAAAERARLAQIEADRIAAEQKAESDRLAALAAEQEAAALRERESAARLLKQQADAQAEKNRKEQEDLARQRQELLDLQAEAARTAAQREAGERARAAADAQRKLDEQAARIAAERAPAPAAPRIGGTRAAHMQTLADQHLADGRAAAQAERAAGLAAGSLRAAGDSLFDAVTDAGPTDEAIIAFGAEHDMDLDELIPRLERFIAGARAGRVLIAA